MLFINPSLTGQLQASINSRAVSTSKCFYIWFNFTHLGITFVQITFCSVCMLTAQCCSYMKTDESLENAVQSHCNLALQEIAYVITHQVFHSLRAQQFPLQ